MGQSIGRGRSRQAAVRREGLIFLAPFALAAARHLHLRLARSPRGAPSPPDPSPQRREHGGGTVAVCAPASGSPVSGSVSALVGGPRRPAHASPKGGPDRAVAELWEVGSVLGAALSLRIEPKSKRETTADLLQSGLGRRPPAAPAGGVERGWRQPWGSGRCAFSSSAGSVESAAPA